MLLAMFRACLAIVAVVASCGSSHRSNAELRAALASCADAFRQIAAHDANAPFSDVTAIYARGCNDLYSEPACRRAIAQLADVSPDARVATIARACSGAYCAKLGDPKPRLCTAGLGSDTGDLGEEWRELDARILALELGSDGADIARVAGALTRETAVKVELPQAPAVPEAVERIAVSLAGDRVDMTVAGKTWKVGAEPSASELAPILAAIDKTHQVVITTAQDVHYATISALLQALRAAGVTHVALATP